MNPMTHQIHKPTTEDIQHQSPKVLGPKPIQLGTKLFQRHSATHKICGNGRSSGKPQLSYQHKQCNHQHKQPVAQANVPQDTNTYINKWHHLHTTTSTTTNHPSYYPPQYGSVTAPPYVLPLDTNVCIMVIDIITTTTTITITSPTYLQPFTIHTNHPCMAICQHLSTLPPT